MTIRSICIVAASVVLTMLGAQAASAGPCLVYGPGYSLASDIIHWQMRTKASQECVRGLRGGAMILRSVELVSPPKSGEVVVSGPSFTFTANADASGEDSFTLRMQGSINGLDGTSTVVIRVLYSDPGATASSASTAAVPLRSDKSAAAH